MKMNEKISPDHLKRAAYVYVRQSTGHQVRHHHQGRERQYELTARAEKLGFARIVVIDDDQGRSGSGSVERPGFTELLSAVCRGDVGAVFALEASRLARNNLDWHHLIELCALTKTLIIDTNAVYDPRLLNDRLLLGLQGTMSEFELGLFRQRAREAFERKIRSGHAMWELPVGFVRTDEHRVEKIADRQVQTSMEGLFAKFRELGSARQTMLWYRDEQIPLPEIVPGTAGRDIHWRLPSDGRIRQILKNPCYAGALAYGRTEAKTTTKDGRPRKSSTRRRKPRDQWKVLIIDNHVGYIDWETYLENLAILESNGSMRDGEGKGAAKTGPALLAGLLRCAHCGRKLRVTYGGTGGRVPRYGCHGGRLNRGHSACQSLGGVRVEQAVSQAVLEAIAPAGIQASLDALEQFHRGRQEKRRSLELALEKARYQTQRAWRQYDGVDPENRLVAGELEARWNAALRHESELEKQLASLDTERRQLADEERQRLLALGSDLPALWNDEAASDELKKRVLRTVLEEIVIGDNEDRTEHILRLHWKGGVHTELRVVRNSTGQRAEMTEKTALDLIEELSKVCSDQAIAATLNRLGYRTGAGKTWRVHSVYSTRYYYRLPNHRNNDAWLTVEQAAQELGVSQTVIRRLIREKTLPAEQVLENTPWIIAREDLSLPDVQADVNAVRQGRQLRRQNPNQQELPFK
jgi:excisionase family DNA binding protein